MVSVLFVKWVRLYQSFGRKPIDFSIVVWYDLFAAGQQIEILAELGKVKKKEFLYIAGLLNKQLHIVPLLFGSLGLEQRLHTDLDADDIDVLVPEVFLNEEWDRIAAIMNHHGYVLYDLHEHAFEKSGLSFAFASIESLTPFAGVDPARIPIVEETGVRYYLLNLQDYLKVYTASSKDGYRKNVKNKRDEQKIALISEALRKKESVK